MAAVVLVAAGVGGTFLLDEPEPAPAGSGDEVPAIPEDASPQELADRACDYLTNRLPEQIREDAPARDVRTDVLRAERETEAAAAEDVQFVALASGVAALRVALEDDDAGAADVAIRVVTTECEP